MNVLLEGPHACADWLIVRVRAEGRPVALFYFESGRLHVGRASQARCPVTARPAGVYAKGLRYADVLADMQVIAAECREAKYAEVA